MRLPKRKTVIVGGSVLAGLTTLAATVVRKRFVTGEANVKQLIDTEPDGTLVVLNDGKVFWAPEDIRGVLETFVQDGAPAMPYRIDQFRRTRSGRPIGTVCTD